MLKLPPPVTGVTKMCSAVLQNRELNHKFTTKVIGLSYAKDVKNTGEFSPLKIFKLFINLAKTKFTILTFRPDLVYFVPSLTGAPFLRDFLFNLILKFFRRKVIFHLHGTGLKDAAFNSKLYKTLYSISFNNSEIIILSEKLKNDIDFLNPARIYILPNGIADFPVSLPATAPPPPLLVKVGGEERRNLLFVSNFYAYKGIPELIELLSEVHGLGFKFSCKIAGEENHITETELRQLIEKNGLTENVFYVGSVQNDDLNSLYDEADIFIYPTKKDAMPLVILEAMRSGLAILANPVGAIPDMIGNNPETLPTIDNLVSLLTNPDKTRRMGEQNRKTFEQRFTINKFNDALFIILDESTQSLKASLLC